QGSIIQGSIKSAPVLSVMRSISLDSHAEKATVIALDKIVSPSSKSVRAKRLSLELACPVFHDLIVLELARSAVALAQLWDRAYLESQNPHLEGYHSFHYPL